MTGMICPKSSFQLVSEMNEAFGNPKGDPNAINGTKLVSQCKNIAKELQELYLALGYQFDFTLVQVNVPEDKSIDDIRDALIDISVFTLGAHHFMGYDADRDMSAVIDSLYSRFCSTPEQLEATQRHFNDLDVEFYIEGDFPTVCLKSARDQGDGEYPKGKFLKAVGHKKPTFYQVDAPLPLALPSMQEMREASMRELSGKYREIDERVKAFRLSLEKDILGFEPFKGDL